MGSIARMDHPQVVGTCPGHNPQPIAQNRVFKTEKPGPPLSLYFIVLCIMMNIELCKIYVIFINGVSLI